MTKTTAQTASLPEEAHPKRGNAPQAMHVNPAPAPIILTTADDPNNTLPDPAEHPHLAKLAHWIHEHPNAPKHGLGHLTYQVARSIVSSVPYGISMAATLGTFEAMKRSSIPRLQQFANFAPTRTAALVATSFTLYRGTSKLGKWMTEYLFNEKDTELQTLDKLDDLPTEIVRKVKEIAPAEANSTPIAALALGFISNAFQKPSAEALKDAAGHSLDWTRANYQQAVKEGRGLKLLGSVIAHPKAKFLEQTAINTLGYGLFFEIGDRLFKDKQIARGVWPGEHHSIKALKAAPDEYRAGMLQETQQDPSRHAGSALEPQESKSHYGFFTDEPSLGRFAFRRLLPTAVGMTAYTAFKFRHSYMGLGPFQYEAHQPILKQMPRLALIEGTATSLFFVVPLVAENWEKWYDHYFDAKEKEARAQAKGSTTPPTLTAEQERNYERLAARIQAHSLETSPSIA